MSREKSIYGLGIKEMRKLIRDFAGTLYGRTVFFLAYFIPAMAFLVMTGLVIAEMIIPLDGLPSYVAITFLVFLGTFALGNVYYYCELRIFAEKR